MSSAVLYLAIVAIWALVLVPRWVRPRHSAPRSGARQQTLESQLTEPVWPRRVEDFAWAGEDEAAEEGEVRRDRGAVQDRQVRPDGDTVQAAAGHGGGAVADRGPSAAGERASILRARRRALIALLLLTGGAVAIAVRHLAADWVVIPAGGAARRVHAAAAGSLAQRCPARQGDRRPAACHRRRGLAVPGRDARLHRAAGGGRGA